MQQYDTTLKLLLHESATATLRELTGTTITHWIDQALPRVQNPRLDLLGQGADGSLIHIELQSTNEPDMPLRMAEYALGVYRLLRQFPRQILLYVGQPPLAMPEELRGPDVLVRYRAVDFRQLDGDQLLESDNVIAILGTLIIGQRFVRSWRSSRA
jgi:hypothetical protein